MQMRLAFAVAAFLEPEILVVDEVLAVGDARFQKKCLGKMEDSSRDGRTVVIVSHNLPLVTNLCRSAVLLERGEVKALGGAADIVRLYLEGMVATGGEAHWPDPAAAPGDGSVRLHAVGIFQEGCAGPTAEVDIARPVRVRISYWNLIDGNLSYAGLWLRDRVGVDVLASTSSPSMSLADDGWTARPRPRGLYHSECVLPGNFLNEGRYSVTAIVGKPPAHLADPGAGRGVLRRARHGADAAGILRPVAGGRQAPPGLAHRAGSRARVAAGRGLRRRRVTRRERPAGAIRVCFVNWHTYPYFNPAAGIPGGGAELQLYTLATELAKDPGSPSPSWCASAGQPATEVREGVAIHGFTAPGPGPPYTGEARYVRALWRRLRAIGPEIIVQRAAGALTGELAPSGASCTGWPSSTWSRTIPTSAPRPRPGGTPGARGAVNWAIYRLGLRLAARVIVQHPGQAALLRGRYGREGLLRPCAQRFPGTPAPPRERFVLWVARAEPWKQPERFLELAAAFPQERFVMVCPPAESDPALARRTQREAARLPNLEFRGFVPYPEVEELFARALLFVNTSRAEGFPNTFVQAWKHGTPVLSLAVDPEGALGEHGLGVVCGGEPARLRAELAALLGDPARRETIARDALAWARARHDVAVQIEADKANLRALWRERFGRRG